MRVARRMKLSELKKPFNCKLPKTAFKMLQYETSRSSTQKICKASASQRSMIVMELPWKHPRLRATTLHSTWQRLRTRWMQVAFSVATILMSLIKPKRNRTSWSFWNLRSFRPLPPCNQLRKRKGNCLVTWTTSMASQTCRMSTKRLNKSWIVQRVSHSLRRKSRLLSERNKLLRPSGPQWDHPSLMFKNMTIMMHPRPIKSLWRLIKRRRSESLSTRRPWSNSSQLSSTKGTLAMKWAPLT